MSQHNICGLRCVYPALLRSICVDQVRHWCGRSRRFLEAYIQREHVRDNTVSEDLDLDHQGKFLTRGDFITRLVDNCGHRAMTREEAAMKALALKEHSTAWSSHRRAPATDRSLNEYTKFVKKMKSFGRQWRIHLCSCASCSAKYQCGPVDSYHGAGDLELEVPKRLEDVTCSAVCCPHHGSVKLGKFLRLPPKISELKPVYEIKPVKVLKTKAPAKVKADRLKHKWEKEQRQAKHEQKEWEARQKRRNKGGRRKKKR